MGDRLKNKIAIVTGAGSVGRGWGNGKATAVLFAREGAKIFAVDISVQAVQEAWKIITDEGASDEAKYITGALLVVDGGLTCKFV